MSNTLQEISDQKKRIWALIAETGGEINETAEKWLAEVDHNLATKVDSYEFIQQELAQEAGRLRNESKAIMAAVKAIENLSDRLKERIKLVMKSMDIDVMKGHRYQYRLSSMAPKLVIDMALLPNAYKIPVTTYEADKEKIQHALLNGEKIPGASYETVYGLRSSINRGQE